MIGDRRAKVTDFSMAKLWDANQQHSQGSFSKRPSPDVYMPPEYYASEANSEKLDCFSFGVICIHVLTQQFPQPGQQFKVVHISDPNFPDGIETRATEAERRKEHIDMVDSSHLLLPVALDCIKDKAESRPSSKQLCKDLASLKETEQYAESVQLSNTDRLMEDIEKQVLDIQKLTFQLPLEEEIAGVQEPPPANHQNQEDSPAVNQAADQQVEAKEAQLENYQQDNPGDARKGADFEQRVRAAESRIGATVTQTEGEELATSRT